MVVYHHETSSASAFTSQVADDGSRSTALVEHYSSFDTVLLDEGLHRLNLRRRMYICPFGQDVYVDVIGGEAHQSQRLVQHVAG